MTTGGQESSLSQDVSWQRAGPASRCSEHVGPDPGRRPSSPTVSPAAPWCVINMFLARQISAVDSSLATPNVPIWTANVFIGLPSASEQNGGYACRASRRAGHGT